MNNIKRVQQLFFHLKATKFTLLLGLQPVKTWLKHSTIWTASYAYKSVHRTEYIQEELLPILRRFCSCCSMFLLVSLCLEVLRLVLVRLGSLLCVFPLGVMCWYVICDYGIGILT